jgi:lipopolysaccharide heptosyltransferase II
MKQQFLIIQTAFIGDVVLATSLIEKLHQFFPDVEIDFLVRKGNQGLLTSHPYLREVLVWDKSKDKLRNLVKIIRVIRKRKYDKVINVQRFFATGVLTIFSGAKEKIGFDKNPLSFLFTKKVRHVFSDGTTIKHETERNNDLVRDFTDAMIMKPGLYPSATDDEAVKKYKTRAYLTISPASVWFTKQYPKEKWVEFLDQVPSHYIIYIIGAPADAEMAGQIIRASKNKKLFNLCGQLSFLQSASLIKDSAMNYSNDSAPMHLASAMNAPVTAIYCSTLPSFGFGPVADKSIIVETEEKLACRPCGLHGKKECPLGHFKCAYTIKSDQLLKALPTA